MAGLELVLCLLVVSILWGVTNPLLKRASVGIEDIQMSNPLLQTLYEVKFLASRFSYVFPFLLNQLGSVVFVYLLGAADLSLAVPISNSLTFLVTTVAGHCLGEETTSRMTWVGAGLVCAGVTLCVADKAQ
ncbi:transmembrane protein 234 homolog [Penaeus chinensis]|uniref:transmembrane protein 234 homolog n=1 Tax=Penaeus chinensis TaxID=139456 RepID=UPI001FB63D6C|nr:transmembrane protein 234 homolog [Penaeus chinensis]XP_047469887.1 transmembrane protein 234 homolog [Penaeus chinensis]